MHKRTRSPSRFTKSELIGKMIEAGKESIEVQEIFFGLGSEPLTDQVIKELVSRGWPESELKRMQASGYIYNRNRDSLLAPDLHFY
jgi:hypothetical protein